jgi:serine/threonine-protein kinase RIO1
VHSKYTAPRQPRPYTVRGNVIYVSFAGPKSPAPIALVSRMESAS